VTGRLRGAAVGAVVVWSALKSVRGTALEIRRPNFRGRPVSLAAGPAFAAAATVTSTVDAVAVGRGRFAAALAVAGAGAGAAGWYDDVAGDRSGVKGLRGHLAALLAGRPTSGVVKAAGIAASSVLAAALLPSREALLPSREALLPSRDALLPSREALLPSREALLPSRGKGAVDVALGAAVIAGAAHLGNLLDLRPGRALKVGATVLTLGGPEMAGPLGAATALLPADLGERVMLGDCGASALGALAGTAFAARSGRTARWAAFLGLAGLALAAERVSFTAVIEETPWLRRLDRLGRQPIGLRAEHAPD
jgi:hypothetical protein